MDTKRSVCIGATIEEMAAADVASVIGSARYDAIKQTDPKPMFIRLKVAYEGISRGAVTLAGQTKVQAKRWYRAVVDELAHRLNFGAPGLFVSTRKPGEAGHGDKTDRPRLGEVLAAFSEDVSGRREASAVAYVSDAGTRSLLREGRLTTCSVEADVMLAGLDTDEPFVQSVDAATGVALAGPDETPGFAGAGVEAVIQELTSRHGGIDEMNAADMQGKKPSDLFNRNELLEDPVVQRLIDAGREKQYGELTDAKAKIAELEDEIRKSKDQVGDLQTQLKAVGSTANAGRVGKLVDDKVAALKLTAPEKARVATSLKKSVQVDDPDVADEDLEKTVAAAVKDAEAEVMEWRSLYGKKADAGDSGATNDDDAGAGDDRDGDDGDDDFLARNRMKKKGDEVVRA